MRLAFAITAALTLAPSLARAADLFITPASAATGASGAVTLELTDGAFPASGAAPRPQQIAVARASRGLLVVRPAGERLQLRLVDAGPGLQAAGVTLRPEPGRGEVRVRHAKALVCNGGRCPVTPDTATPLGAGLEFIPLPGLQSFVLLANGRPAPNASVEIATRSGRSATRTDARGVVSSSDGVGPVLLSAITTSPPARPGGLRGVEVATLSFQR